MSIMLMSRIFRMNIGGCNRKLLAVRLADFADDDGRGIYPGVERLSLETELSERTVQRILADFEKEGILICRQRASGRPGVANRYDFDLERLFACDAAAAKAGSKPQTGDSVSPVTDAETGDNPDERGDNGDIEGCHGDTRTVIEPPLEPLSEREGASEREEGEDRKAIERAYWALVKDWPGFAGMPKEPALKDWMRLTAEERQEAAERFRQPAHSGRRYRPCLPDRPAGTGARHHLVLARHPEDARPCRLCRRAAGAAKGGGLLCRLRHRRRGDLGRRRGRPEGRPLSGRGTAAGDDPATEARRGGQLRHAALGRRI